MKKTILILLLLASFSIAEESNTQIQETVETTSTELQDLGRGYAKDPTGNTFYYIGRPIEVLNPNLFEVSTVEDINGFDATEGDVIGYIKGERIVCHPESKCFSTKLNVPVACISVMDNPTELLACYQEVTGDGSWSQFSTINPQDFKILGASKTIIGLNKKPIWTNLELYSTDYQNVYISASYRSKTLQMEHADPATFEILSYPYTKDKNHVFWRDYKIEKADPITFKPSFYALHKQRAGEPLIPNSYYFSRDKKYVFFAGAIVDEADPETFELLSKSYARDKNHVFYLSVHGASKIQDADPKTFSILSTPYARDDNYIFEREYRIKSMSGVDTMSLVYLGKPEGSDNERDDKYNNQYFKDKYKIYYQGPKKLFIEIKGADLETFEILDYPYAKDKNYVYYHGKVIPNFSSQGFNVDHSLLNIGHNESSVVYLNRILPNLSSKDFEIITDSTPPFFIFGSIILKNKETVYLIIYLNEGEEDYRIAKIIPLALDAASIEFIPSLGGEFLKDKKGVYFFPLAKNLSTTLLGVTGFQIDVDPQTVQLIYGDDHEYRLIQDKDNIYSRNEVKKKEFKQYAGVVLYVNSSEENVDTEL